MAGLEAVAVDYGGVAGAPSYEEVARRIAGSLDGAGWTVVVHSGAGSLVPAIVEALDAPAGFVFVDAILPHPGRSWLQAAPSTLAEQVRAMATDGHLPPWNMWFASDPLERMVTNGSLRAVLTEELPLVPLVWLEAISPDLKGWTSLPGAYLQLSGAYAAEAAGAEARGWTVRRLALHHLAMITDPGKITDALMSLAQV